MKFLYVAVFSSMLALPASALMGDHSGHAHKHADDCGHKALKHDGHMDYLHNGHLHHVDSEGYVLEHKIAVTEKNPASEMKVKIEHSHAHSKECGHPKVPHGDHVDALHNGHLHHMHEDHTDEHGEVAS